MKTDKLIAYAVVFAIAFFGCLRLLEGTSVVSMNVDQQVEAGKVAVASAPRLTVVVEYSLAALFALFIATSHIGHWAASCLVRLWKLLRGRVTNTLARAAADKQPDPLEAVLTEHEKGIADLQKLFSTLELRVVQVEAAVGKPSTRTASTTRTTRRKGGAA